MDTRKKQRYFLYGLIGALVLLVVITGMTIYTRSRPQTKYLSSPKISQQSKFQHADVLLVAQVKQQVKTTTSKGVPTTVFRLRVKQNLTATKLPQTLTIAKKGGRNPQTGSVYLYHNDQFPLVNKTYVFALTHDHSRLIAAGPYSTVAANPKNIKQASTLAKRK